MTMAFPRSRTVGIAGFVILFAMRDVETPNALGLVVLFGAAAMVLYAGVAGVYALVQGFRSGLK